MQSTDWIETYANGMNKTIQKCLTLIRLQKKT